jgi:hypothetical protein
MEDQLKQMIKESDAQKIVEEMEEKYHLSTLEDLIKDNKIIFVHEGKTYQVRLLEMADKEILDEMRRKKFGQLLQDKDILLEKDLIKVYKDRGIDVENINKQLAEIESAKVQVQIKLGEYVAQYSEESIIRAYQEEIAKLKVKEDVLIIQKTTLLEYSLENQLNNFLSKVISYLALYVKNGEKLEKAFTNYEDFCKCTDQELLNKSAAYSLILQYA